MPLCTLGVVPLDLSRERVVVLCAGDDFAQSAHWGSGGFNAGIFDFGPGGHNGGLFNVGAGNSGLGNLGGENSGASNVGSGRSGFFGL